MFSNVWQKPFLPILKNSKWSKKDLILTSGKVTQELDRQIGKTIFNITGSVSASNYLQIPADDSRGLGVKGSILYLMLCRPSPSEDGEYYMIHLDCNASNCIQEKFDRKVPFKMGFRLSFSNMYKSTKMSGQTIQIPLELQPLRWTVLVLDLKRLIGELVPLQNYTAADKRSNSKLRKTLLRSKTRSAGSRAKPLLMPWQYDSLKAIKIGSNLKFWTVFSSDNFYSPGGLPKGLQFPGGRANWYQMYNWQEFPERIAQHTMEVPQPQSSTKISDSPRILKNIQPDELEAKNDERAAMVASMDNMIQTRSSTLKDFINKEDDDVENFPTEVLHVKEPKLFSYEDVEKKKSENFMLPDPIMSLESVISVSKPQWPGGRTACWIDGGKSVAFAANNLIVLMDLETRKQRFLIGHTDAVCCIAANARGTSLLASAQGGPTPVVRVWDTKSCSCIAYITAQEKKISSIDFSVGSRFLVIAGVDARGRTLISVWDTSTIQFGGRATEVARQVSEYDISTIKFYPSLNEESPSLISCGNGNIRLWRISKGHLPGRSVPLESDNRQNFTDVSFNVSLKPHERFAERAYVSSEEGWVFQVNYSAAVLECIYRVHDGSINSLLVNPGFCVTGSSDRFVRVWPLEFSDFYIQVQFTSQVECVDVSPDGLSVLVCTADGCLGILDMQTTKHVTILRSHTDTIRSITMDPNSSQFATASEDGSVRIWSLTNLEQTYQFDCKGGEKITSAAYFPVGSGIVACGFSSGSMRVCNTKDTGIDAELQQHDGEVIKLQYTPDGKYLFSLGKDAFVCIYDCERNYEPIHMLKTSSSNPTMDLSYVPCLGRAVLYIKSESVSSALVAVDIFTFQQVYQIDCGNEILCSMVSPDKTELLVLTSTGEVVRFSSQDGSLICSNNIPKSLAMPGAFFNISPQNRYVASGMSGNMISIWDYYGSSTTSKSSSTLTTQVFSGQHAPVESICFLKNSSKIISASGDAVYVWKFYGKDTHPDKPVDQSAFTQEMIEKVRKYSDDFRDMMASFSDDFELSDTKHGTPAPTNKETTSSGKTKSLKESQDQKEEETATKPALNRAKTTPTPKLATKAERKRGRSLDNKDLLVQPQIEAEIEHTQQIQIEPIFDEEKLIRQPILVRSGKDASMQKEHDDDAMEQKKGGLAAPNVTPMKTASEKNVTAATPFSQQTHISLAFTEQEGDKQIAPDYQEPSISRQSCLAGAEDLAWHSEKGILVYANGNQLIIQDLKNDTTKISGTAPPQRIVRAHNGRISTVAISHDGSLLATGSYIWDKVATANYPDQFLVRVFDSKTGACMLSVTKSAFFEAIGLKATDVGCRSIKFDREKNEHLCFYVYGNVRGICIWEMEGGGMLSFQSLNPDIKAFCCISGSRFGHQPPFAVATIGKDLSLWSKGDGKTLEENKIEGTSLAISRDEHFTFLDCAALASHCVLVVGTSKGRVFFLGLDDKPGVLGCMIVAEDTPLTSIFCTSNATFSIIQADNVLSTFLMRSTPSNSPSPFEILRTHRTKLKFSPRAVCTDQLPSLALVSDKLKNIWCVQLQVERKAEKGKTVKLKEQDGTLLLTGHTSCVTQAKFSSDDNFLISAGADGGVMLWDMQQKTLGQRLILFQVQNRTPCLAMAIHPTRLVCAASYQNGIVRIVDLENFQLKAKLQVAQESVTAINFLGEGNIFAAGTSTGRIILTHWENNQVLLERVLHAGVESIQVFQGDGDRKTWLATHTDRTLSIWYEDKLTCRVNVADIENIIPESIIFDAQDPENPPPATFSNEKLSLLLETRAVPKLAAAFHPHKAVVVFCIPSKTDMTKSTVVFFDFTQKKILNMINVSGYGTSVAVSPDGKLVALGCLDQVVRLVQGFNYEEKLLPSAESNVRTIWSSSIVRHFDWVSFVEFSSDATILASGSDDAITLTELENQEPYR